MKDAGQWITAAKPTYTALIDDKHVVTKLYHMVNVPTGVWINEAGRIVRPNEVAFVDDRFKTMHGQAAAPYLEGLRDWVEKGDRSRFVMNAAQIQEALKPLMPDHAQADAEFALGEHLYQTGRGAEAIPHFKEAQRLNPDSWNYKRQAWALANADRDYGTNFRTEVQKLNGKPYYAPRLLPNEKDEKPRP